MIIGKIIDKDREKKANFKLDMKYLLFNNKNFIKSDKNQKYKEI